MKIHISALAAFAGVALFQAQAQAGELNPFVENSEVKLSGGFGLKNVTANELVYSGGSRLSQLIWKSSYMRVASGELSVKLDQGWIFRAAGGIGFGGNGHMTDYDWISPYATGTGDNDWSHRSVHPNTQLNQFFEASAEVGRELYGNSTSSLDVTGGFKYTNVKWTTWGGSYIYSSGGYHNTVGDFAATMKGVTFEQRLPVIFAGLNGESTSGAWSFTSKLRGGITVAAGDIDDHWQRNLRFYDKYKIAPVLAAEVAAEYHLRSSVSAFASASFEKVFRAKGDIYTVNTSTNAVTYSPGAAGGDFETIGFSVGLKGKF